MENILEQIIKSRRITVEKMKSIIPAEAWKKLPLFGKKRKSLKANLLRKDSTGIIAEFKRASPSKGKINDKVNAIDITTGYERFGAAGISILTEPEYFEGNTDDLLTSAQVLRAPILRKDFIFDEYQILESAAYGADVILLIAACLLPNEVKQLASAAKQLGLEVLLEIHNEEELKHICDEVDMVGVNNRNLKTFEVDIDTSLQLINRIPAAKPAISESGISDVDTILSLSKAGFKGFLIGENFMKQPDPTIAFAEFIQELKAKQNAY